MDSEEYKWFKEHHICANCRKEPAVEGHTVCLRCLFKKREYDRKHDKERSLESRKRQVKHQKEKREKCIKQGICRECLKRKATVGKYCLECYIKKKKRNEKRKKNRQLYTEMGLCYFCGEPVETGFKTCKKHHNIMAKNLHRENLDNSNHVWRKIQRAEVTKMRYRE